MDRDTEHRLLAFCEGQHVGFNALAWLAAAESNEFALLDLCSAAFLLRTTPEYGNGIELLGVTAMLSDRLADLVQATKGCLDARSPAQVIRSSEIDPTHFRSMLCQGLSDSDRRRARQPKVQP